MRATIAIGFLSAVLFRVFLPELMMSCCTGLVIAPALFVAANTAAAVLLTRTILAGAWSRAVSRGLVTATLIAITWFFPLRWTCGLFIWRHSEFLTAAVREEVSVVAPWGYRVNVQENPRRVFIPYACIPTNSLLVIHAPRGISSTAAGPGFDYVRDRLGGCVFHPLWGPWYYTID